MAQHERSASAPALPAISLSSRRSHHSLELGVARTTTAQKLHPALPEVPDIRCPCFNRLRRSRHAASNSPGDSRSRATDVGPPDVSVHSGELPWRSGRPPRGTACGKASWPRKNRGENHKMLPGGFRHCCPRRSALEIQKCQRAEESRSRTQTSGGGEEAAWGPPERV